jgi:hypothetical protein
MEEILKTAYQILARPLRSSVIISSALAALLAIFSMFSVASGSVQESTAAVPLNAIFSLVTIGVTLLPGLFFRLFSYARIADVIPIGINHDRLKLTAIIALVIESLNIVFLLNAYMAAITGGAVGALGVLAIAGFNLFWMAIWGFAALVLYFRGQWVLR